MTIPKQDFVPPAGGLPNNNPSLAAGQSSALTDSAANSMSSSTTDTSSNYQTINGTQINGTQIYGTAPAAMAGQNPVYPGQLIQGQIYQGQYYQGQPVQGQSYQQPAFNGQPYSTAPSTVVESGYPSYPVQTFVSNGSGGSGFVPQATTATGNGYTPPPNDLSVLLPPQPPKKPDAMQQQIAAQAQQPILDNSTPVDSSSEQGSSSSDDAFPFEAAPQPTAMTEPTASQPSITQNNTPTGLAAEPSAQNSATDANSSAPLVAAPAKRDPVPFQSPTISPTVDQDGTVRPPEITDLVETELNQTIRPSATSQPTEKALQETSAKIDNDVSEPKTGQDDESDNSASSGDSQAEADSNEAANEAATIENNGGVSADEPAMIQNSRVESISEEESQDADAADNPVSVDSTNADQPALNQVTVLKPASELESTIAAPADSVPELSTDSVIDSTSTSTQVPVNNLASPNEGSASSPWWLLTLAVPVGLFLLWHKFGRSRSQKQSTRDT